MKCQAVFSLITLLALARCSLQAPATLNYDQFHESVAKTMMRYSVAAYYLQENSGWTCTNPAFCSALPSFTLRKTVDAGVLAGRAFIGYDSALHAIVISVRGTDALENWLANMYAWPTETTIFGSAAGKIHGGFYEIYKALREPIIQELNAMLSESQYAGARVFATGHSMGGVIASLFALEIKMRDASVNPVMYSFGSPRFGDETFARTYESRVAASFRVVNEYDVFTTVPPEWMTYRHVWHKVTASESAEHSTYLGISTR